MLITSAALDGIFDGYSMAFNKGFEGLEPFWPKVAMKVNSTHAQETYGWLEQLPHMREWLGDRVVNNLVAAGYAILNRDFEQTIGVPRNQIEDDSYGLFAPAFQEMGRVANELPDKLIVELMTAGFDHTGYDGQNFFDTDHAVTVDGATVSVANTDGGSGQPWFLLDSTRAIRPFIYQERRPFTQLVRKDKPEDDNVFFRKQFIYGSDGRGNAGYGLWQMCWGSKQTLNAENYGEARSALLNMKGENGRKLGIRPNVLVVGSSNESAARKLLINDAAAGGESNEWKGTAELFVTPWL